MNEEMGAWQVSTKNHKQFFSSYQNLEDYITREHTLWSWIVKGVPSAMGQSLYSRLIQDHLTPLRRNAENIRDGGTITDEHYISTTSPTGTLILETLHEHGEIAAAILLVFLHPDRKTFTNNHTNFNLTVAGPTYTYERELASYIAFEHLNIKKIVSESSLISVDESTREFSSLIESTRLRVIAVESDANSRITELVNSGQKRWSLDENSFNKRVRRYQKLARQTLEQSTQSVTQAVTDLASAKAAYHDEVDLDASVSYWKKRKSGHMIGKYSWLAGILLCMTMTFIGLVGYYKLGGVSGISKHEIVSAKTTDSQNTPPEIAQTSSASAITIPGTSPFLVAGIADLAGAALLIALLSVLLRIGLRQFNTHSHLALDAEERVTMTKTYLALLNEGKLKSEEDRRLVLETLFRASQTGGVAETSFSGPIELIVKAITENKGPK